MNVIFVLILSVVSVLTGETAVFTDIIVNIRAYKRR